MKLNLQIDSLRKNLVIADILFFIASVTATYFNSSLDDSILKEQINRLAVPIFSNFNDILTLIVLLLYIISYSWFLVALYRNSKTAIKAFWSFLTLTFIFHLTDLGPQLYDPLSESFDTTSSIFEGVIFTLYLFENNFLSKEIPSKKTDLI